MMKHLYHLLPLLLLLSSVQVSHTQTQAKVFLGSSAFLDEDIPFDHFLLGASMRLYLKDRLSVEPEFLYLKGPGTDRDYLFTGNIAYDIVRWERGSLYIIGGAGVLHHTEKFPGAVEENFAVNDWTASGGVGAQIFISRSVFVTSEFRIGWEPLLRASGGIGFEFGRGQ